MPILILTGPTFIPLNGSGTFEVTFIGSDGVNSLYPPNTPGWPDPIGVSHDGVYTFVFTPDPVVATYDVVFYDSQTNTYSNHIRVQVGQPEENWIQFPVGSVITNNEEYPLTIQRSWRQPATLSGALSDSKQLLNPLNKGSVYNQNSLGNYDPLLTARRKILFRCGTRVWPNVAAGITPTASLSPSTGSLSLLTDGLFGDVTQGSGNFCIWTPGSASPFTVTFDLTTARNVKHVGLSFASKLNTCTFPASVSVAVSNDGSTWTSARQAARPVGGTTGDWNDSYTGDSRLIAITSNDQELGLVPGLWRYVRVTITPTGAQTLYCDEIALYGDNGSAALWLGGNRFVGYLGRDVKCPATGIYTFTADDALRKEALNNEAWLPAQETNADVADILYTLETSESYWKGSGTDFDAPLLPYEIGWSQGVNYTGMNFPVWQDTGMSILGYMLDLINVIGWMLRADGNGIRQIEEPSYSQVCPDRVLIADDADGNIECRDNELDLDDDNLRNIADINMGNGTQGTGRTEVYDLNSIAKYGRERVSVTDPNAITGAIQQKLGDYILRDYAHALYTLKNNFTPRWGDRPGKIMGVRASQGLYSFLRPKSNGSSWDGYLWRLHDMTEYFTETNWHADGDFVQYFPQGPDAPTGITLTASVEPNQVVLSWNAITDPSVTGINIYRSTVSNGSLGVPEAQWHTFAKLAGMPLAASATSYTDGSLIAGQDYWYWLTSVNSLGIESVPSPIYWARPGTDVASDSDWTITTLQAGYVQQVGPENGLPYYEYEFQLLWTSPGPSGADLGRGGTKRFVVYCAIAAAAPDRNDLTQWTALDSWSGTRVKPGYMNVGQEASAQTAGSCEWLARLKTTTAMPSGQSVFFFLLSSAMSTKQVGPSNNGYPSNTTFANVP